MRTILCNDPTDLGARAAAHGAQMIRNAIEDRGAANIILATGASQFATLQSLLAADEIDWSKVTVFHLDEYIGMSAHHPASFRRFLRERFADHVNVRMFHYIRADAADLEAELSRLKYHLSRHPIDVAFIGIGENGHIAFNDPPADFETDEPYIVVQLDEACRRQQHGEGWFESMEAVPMQAVSMSVRQIMKSRVIICSVPDERKAEAVRRTVQSEVHPDIPASILQQHPAATLYLDEAAASRLEG